MTKSQRRVLGEASADFGGQAALKGSGFSRHHEVEFLAELGARVREMRSLRDMSRQALARKSGISERYIAQIEAGKGNVSITLLLRLAHAIRFG